MADIEDYSTTPASNTDDFPEGQLPSTVNNGARETQADIAKFRERLQGEFTVGGTVDAITIVNSSPVTGLVNNRLFTLRATGANTSTTPTLKEDSQVAKTIVKNGNQALVAGDIPRADYECIFKYNSTNDNYELLNPNSIFGGGALVYRSVSLSLSNATFTPIPFDLEEYDTSSIHDNVTNNTRLVVPSGVTKVRLFLHAQFASNSTGTRTIGISKNDDVGSGAHGLGYQIQQVAAEANIQMMFIPSPIISVTGGDYFSAVAYQNSGGALSLFGGGSTGFAMEIIA